MIDLKSHDLLWLDPIELYQEDSNPLVSVLVRISHVVAVATDESLLAPGFERIKTNLRQITASAAEAFPGNLHARVNAPARVEQDYDGFSYSSTLDREQYAAEVIRNEEIRMMFPSQFKQIIEELSLQFQRSRLTREPAIFVLPLLDYDIYLRSQSRLLNIIQHYIPKELHILIVGDCVSKIKWRNNDQFHYLESRDFKALDVPKNPIQFRQFRQW